MIIYNNFDLFTIFLHYCFFLKDKNSEKSACKLTQITSFIRPENH